MRGILTLMMLLAAYSIAGFDESIEAPYEIDVVLYDDIFEGTVIDVSDDGTGPYNVIHLRSGDIEWVIRYYNQSNNHDAGLATLRQIAKKEALIRVELDCAGIRARSKLPLIAKSQGREIRNIHINPSQKSACQILSSSML